jgi:hypothetical protein
MTAFLKIGNKYIAPAHILSIAISPSYAMRDGMEITRTKVIVTFPNHTETFYGIEAEMLLVWLDNYADITDSSDLPAEYADAYAE